MGTLLALSAGFAPVAHALNLKVDAYVLPRDAEESTAPEAQALHTSASAQALIVQSLILAISLMRPDSPSSLAGAAIAVGGLDQSRSRSAVVDERNADRRKHN